MLFLSVMAGKTWADAVKDSAAARLKNDYTTVLKTLQPAAEKGEA
ncbi:MAG: hypothetical protein ACAH80_14890 [Alphaproteobacteria bacterium]